MFVEKKESPHITIGCVSFLNAKPLIAGLDQRDDIDVQFDVPARLLDDLLADKVDIALCPVIDYQLSPTPLAVVPTGGIASDGETLTVRLFSRIPFNQVISIGVDTDSHTSVMLTRIIMHDMFDRSPQMISFPPDALDELPATWPQTLLLIGDKVVTRQLDPLDYPYQLDLGEAWKQMTGLPFVFATWLTKPQTPLGDLPDQLTRQLQTNLAGIDSIIEGFAPAVGWPVDLARDYLTKHLYFELGQRELEAIQRFWHRAYELKLIDHLRPMVRYGVS